MVGRGTESVPVDDDNFVGGEVGGDRLYEAEDGVIGGGEGSLLVVGVVERGIFGGVF